MNISFNVAKKAKLNDDPVKEQINFYKLHVDNNDRYLSGFDIFTDDNKIICYVSETEIELTYDGIRLTDVDCYSDENIKNKLKTIINGDKTIYENLIKLNDYFKNIEDKISEERKKSFRMSNSYRSKIERVFENEDDDSDILEEIADDSDDSDDSDNSESDCDDNFPKEEVKSVKPVKYEFSIQSKKNIPDLSDDIILTNDDNSDNYISSEIINASKIIMNGKNSTVYQIVNEINWAIKNTKNIIIKPINNVFEVSVENKFNSGYFKYNILIPEKYPYVPPQLSIKSNFNQSLTYALNNCEILNKQKWNPSTTLQDIIVGIYNNIEKYDLQTIQSTIKDDQFFELTTQLLEITNTEPLNTKKFNLNFDFLKINDKAESRGIGYDFTGPENWNVNLYLKEQDDKNKKIINLLKKIVPLISKNVDELNDTCVIPYIKQYVYGVSVMEIDKKKEYYETLFEVFNEVYKLNKYNSHFNLSQISEQRTMLSDYPNIQKNIPIIQKEIVRVDKDDYVEVMKELAFGMENIVEKRNYKFMDRLGDKYMSGDSIKRLTNEIKSLNVNLPISDTSSIFLRCDETNMSVMKFIIIPHPDTPYAYGCFEFDMHIPANYPQRPPHVEIITTGSGQFRFNPNLYDTGKVCLSLLGTWQGPGWTVDSTILQVLISIQSLIFCEEPYFNEPTYERDRNNAKGKEMNNRYNEPVRYQTMRLGMLEQLRNPPYGFEDIIKNHFRIFKDRIFKKLDEWEQIAQAKDTFSKVYNELKIEMNKL